MSSAGSSASTLLASSSSSEITTDCSASCSVVFGHAADIFDFDFGAEGSEDTEIDSFDLNAEATEVADADAEILPLCGFFSSIVLS